MKKLFLLIPALLLVVGVYVITQRAPERTTVYTQSRRVEPKELAKVADFVVEAKVASSTTRIVADPNHGDLVYTDWTLQPIEVWKGKADSQIVASTLGGKSGSTETIISEMPNLAVGDERLFFLTEEPNSTIWTMYSVTQGIFSTQGQDVVNTFGDKLDKKAYKELVKQSK
jgi:hypothetical protein